MNKLTAMLTDDAVLLSDGGGKVLAALNPILGPDHVARFLIGISTKQPKGAFLRVRDVNGAPGLVGYVGNAAYFVASFEWQGDRVNAVHIVNNPEKLTHLGPPDAPTGT